MEPLLTIYTSVWARLLCAILLMLSADVFADQDGDSAPAAQGSRFVDAGDGWFDVSEFLDSAYGFVPVLAPITEPAVGYGAVGALVFIDRKEPGQGQSYARPNIAAIGGLATENGTRGLFAAHLGNWRGGRLRTLAAWADADVNLEFFGLGDDPGPGVDYSLEARGGVLGGNYQIGATPAWLGLRYALVTTQVGLDDPQTRPSGIPASDLDLELAALTASLTWDTRDSFFTPTRGWYLDLSVPVFRTALGSDRDFEKAILTGIYHRPVSDVLYFGARAAARTSSDGTPFFLRPFVMLRGVQALRYQGEQAAELELELRWQLHSRFSLVGFGGAGIARSDGPGSKKEETVTAGGVGFRYLVARKHGLHMGIDVAAGPDDPVIYFVFGSAWLRP